MSSVGWKSFFVMCWRFAVISRILTIVDRFSSNASSTAHEQEQGTKDEKNRAAHQQNPNTLH